ncbi:MAG: tetraacyldisaccharide 4'-kinase [Gammaproteobacteria bacterium]
MNTKKKAQNATSEEKAMMEQFQADSTLGQEFTKTELYFRLFGLLQRKVLFVSLMFGGFTFVSIGNVGFAEWMKIITEKLSSNASAQTVLPPETPAQTLQPSEAPDQKLLPPEATDPAVDAGVNLWEQLTSQLDEWGRVISHQFSNIGETSWMISVLLVVLLTLRGIGTFVGLYSNSRLAVDLAHYLRSQMFRHIVYSNMSSITGMKPGQLITQIMFMVRMASDGVAQIGLVLARDGLQVVGLLSYLFWVNWQMTLLLGLGIPLMIGAFGLASTKIRQAVKDSQSGANNLTQSVSEVIDGITAVKVFQGEEREAEEFNTSSKRLRRVMLLMVTIQGTLIPLVQILTGGLIALITYVALEGYVGEMTGPDFISYFFALGLLLAPLRQMTRANINFEICTMAARNIFGFLDTPIEKSEGRNLPSNDISNITARQLSFSYPEGPPVLKDIDFTLRKGHITAVVGDSGSGKTTLISLLCGFYKNFSGDLTFDGVQASELSILSLRSQIAMVSQQVSIFGGSVAENIRYSHPEATLDEVIEAAKNADAWEFISRLKTGLDTQIGPGGLQLSGGQKQRLSIARAFLCNSSLVILDEATASLDALSERRISKVMKRLAKGRVVMIVSHRLKFVEDAHEILVLSNGEIVERGTHDELMDVDGRYALLQREKPAETVPQQNPVSPVLSIPPMTTPAMEQSLSIIPAASTRPMSVRWASYWYSPDSWLRVFMPLHWLLASFLRLRSALRWFSFWRSKPLPVPVIVVGNLTVGGTGKTPIVAWLAQNLQEKGYRVGIISRGYGGNSIWYPLRVTSETDVHEAGEEALWLHKKTGCPTSVAPDRLQAAVALLQQADCDVILSDDGLQHARLRRDIEIITLDGQRQFGNSMLIPFGPLRELPSSRLKHALCAVTKDQEIADLPCPSYSLELKPMHLVHLFSGQRVTPKDWAWERTVHACAAIGNPHSFFKSLRALGFEVIEHEFRDHQTFQANDLLFTDGLPVIMTEKDAIKCRSNGLRNLWYLEVEPQIRNGDQLIDMLDEALKHAHQKSNKRTIKASKKQTPEAHENIA